MSAPSGIILASTCSADRPTGWLRCGKRAKDHDERVDDLANAGVAASGNRVSSGRLGGFDDNDRGRGADDVKEESRHNRPRDLRSAHRIMDSMGPSDSLLVVLQPKMERRGLIGSGL